MDLNTLRVYNVINNLGLTDTEFEAISIEQECTQYTGTALMKVTPKFMVWIDHDDKHTIEIVPNHTKLTHTGRILFKTFFTFDVPIELFILHGLARYRCDDNTPRYAAKDIEELKDSIMERVCDKKYLEIGDMGRRDYDYYHNETARAQVEELRKVLIKQQLNAIYWLFGESMIKTANTNKTARPNIPMIVKVFQRKNRRLAIIQYDKDFDQKRGNPMYGGTWIEHVEDREIRINIYKPAQPQYNYVNEGRELLWSSSYSDNDEVWLDDDLAGKIPFTELELVNAEVKGFKLLNSKEYGRIQKTIRIKLMEDQRKEIHSKAESKVLDTIAKEFSKGKIVRKGITFTHDSIQYDTMILKAEKIKEYVIGQRIHLSAEPEFTSIYEGYIEWLLKLSNYKSCSDRTATYYSEFEGKTQLSINNIRVAISKEKNLLLVNDRKISKFDVAVVVKNAINYDNQEAYNEYVAEVSRTNLKVQQAVHEGYIAFDIHFNKGDNENFLLKKENSIRISIPLMREKNKNYTIINGARYAISNTEALFDIDVKPQHYYQSGELNRAIKLLYKSIKDITPKVIGDMLKDGKGAYAEHYGKILAEKKAKIDKSKEFLAHAIKLTHATKIRDGYKVLGKSGTVYTINKDTLAVYKNGTTEYLCIVDVGDYELSTEAEALKNDRIAKRLLALHKDTVVAREIYDEGDQIDKHWIGLEG